MNIKTNITFEQLCQNKVNAFYLFTHMKETIPYFDIADMQQLNEKQLQYGSKVINGYLLTVVIAQAFTLFLKKRNLIYQLTYDISMWGLIKKYYLLPSLIIQPFRKQWNEDLFQFRNKLIDKYDFSQNHFENAFNQAKEAGIKQSYLNDIQQQRYIEELVAKAQVK